MLKKTEHGDSFGIESNRDIYEVGRPAMGYWSILFCNVKPRSDLFFKHDFVEISILKFRENSLMNCIYLSPISTVLNILPVDFNLHTSISAPFVSNSFLQYFEANIECHIISPEINKL